MQTESTETDAWQAFSLAVLVRDAFNRGGGEKAGDVTLSADQAEAVLIGLNRLVELTRATAKASV